MIGWLSARLPLDGRGWASPKDERRLLFRSIGDHVKRRLPAPIARLVLAGARAAWLPFAFFRAYRFSRAPPHAAFGTVFLDCLMAGTGPREAWLWRELFGERVELGNRAMSLLLSGLGDPAGHATLADKLATAETLRAAGVAVPETLAIIEPGCAERDLAPVRDAKAGLVIKLPRGFGSSGLIMAEPLAAGRWRLNGKEVSWEQFSGRLQGARQQRLVQPWLRGARSLDGFLEAERPPVLRITTARRPGAAPFLHDAFLAIPVPGNPASSYLTRDLRAPIDAATGRLHAAVLFAEPRRRLASVPWNGAKIEGRLLEGFEAAVRATLVAASAIPPAPVISWDVVLTDTGPVILEGNSMGSWLLVNLGRFRGQGAASLVPLLAEWVAAGQRRQRPS
ncbi:MAG TPA: sugar-transfer associated ATP-grasp domain-containing protein [Caulobacteraceae bacterium]|nr:sugar-transfer associated ATP-grasp domain-containing protein [Caulobacteraceae bacterium]